VPIKRVGVVGFGLMGSGIAQVCAQAGYDTVVREVAQPLLDRGFARVDGSLARIVKAGKLTEDDAKATRGRMRGTTSLEDLKDCDLVIEAVLEELVIKKEVFGTLDALCPPTTIFASNTSSLTIVEMAAFTKRPDRFAGLHFFNPVPLMKLVEVIRALPTGDDTYQTVFAFAQSLGKEAVTAPDRPGFIVNRLLVPYLLDAVRAYENGLGTLEDIDKAMTLGCGYPMGPFTLLDFVGLDTTYYVANVMFEEFKEPAYAPPPLLKRMVLAGRLGRKSGQGFYKY
jgi:3-hydroxybutyryl-CoA dehydrogenase